MKENNLPCSWVWRINMLSCLYYPNWSVAVRTFVCIIVPFYFLFFGRNRKTAPNFLWNFKALQWPNNQNNIEKEEWSVRTCAS